MERKLANYTIESEIGRGGMATVYRAVQVSLNRIVALKELDLSRFRSEANALERFRLEARAAAALDHPNIVTIYDLWEEGGKAYIAMEFVNGVELRDVLANLGPIQYINALLIALDVSKALEYAHRKGMIHRDVKPGNIMLSETGEIRLTDFGIVSVTDAGDLTVTGQILGTPAYMSPEQIAGEEAGPGADLFSLGAVLYEMLTGRKPFSGTNHVALIQDVLHGQPLPPHEQVPEVPESISSAVMKCMEKGPGQRFSSIEEFVTVLEMVMPLDRPDRSEIVSRLVVDTREQVRTRLHTGAGEDDRTSPMVMDIRAGTGTTGTPPGPPDRKGVEASLVKDAGASPYDLEQDPPAELPPLEPDKEKVSGREAESTAISEPVNPLKLKDIPEGEEGTEHFIEETTADRRKRRSVRWFLMVILALILALGMIVWKFTGITGQGKWLANSVKKVSRAHITVMAEPAGKVYMDGEFLGDTGPSSAFVVKPGLHRMEVRHPGFEPRKFIVDLAPGEEKEVEVIFGDQ